MKWTASRYARKGCDFDSFIQMSNDVVPDPSEHLFSQAASRTWGGGHDWAGRALCDGVVIDLQEMNRVVLSSDHRTAQISGGARAMDVLAVTDPLGVAAVAGSVGSVAMAAHQIRSPF